MPESAENVAWLGLHKLKCATVAAYPLLAVMALVETGTRALLGAVIGPVRGEESQALQLVGRLSKDLSVIAGIPVWIITDTVVVTCADDVVVRTHAGRARVRNLQDSRSLLRLDTL